LNTISIERWLASVVAAWTVKKTETTQNIAYAGWDELLKDLEVMTPEQMLVQKAADLKMQWDELVRPHSPLDPEDAAVRALAFGVVANGTYAGLMGLATAVEIGGAGQIETPALMLPHAPIIRGILGTAEASMSAYFDACFNKGMRYYANFQHMPTIIPEEALINLWNMDLLDETTYLAQMMYHGYTPDRSFVYGLTGIRMPDVETVLTLLRRGVLTNKGGVDWLTLAKIPRETAEAITTLYYNIPEPYRITDMYAKRYIDTKTFHESMKWFGIDETWADRWAQAEAMILSPEQLVALVRRGTLTLDGYNAYMAWNKYSKEETEQLATLIEVLPPIDDLIRFAVREAFPVEAGEPQFKEMEKWAGKQGLTPYWVDKYYKAHFNRMGLGQAYSNLWRGYFNKGAFEHYLLLADVHPDDWDAIEKVAFLPPSIRELGYGYDTGVYTLADIETYRRWGGLSPEDAKKSAQAMVAYRTEAERNSVRTEYLYAYGRGNFTREVLTQLLTKLGTAPEAVPLWLERAELYKDRIQKPQVDTEGKIVSSSEALAAYKLGLRPKAWVEWALANLGWTKERIELAVQKVEYDLKPIVTPTTEVKYRLLTAAQMHTLYLKGFIDDEFMLSVFIETGYSPDDAELLTDLYTIVEEPIVTVKPFSASVASDLYYYTIFDEEDLKDDFVLQGFDDGQAWMLVLYTRLQQEYPMLRKLYSTGIIDSAQLKTELMLIGMAEYNADTLVQKTQYETGADRLTKEKDLTKAEIIKGVKNNVFDTAQGVEMLVSLGYDSDEAQYLLMLNKITAAGDPESYLEMKRVTEAYKKARGEKSITIPNEAISLEIQIKTVKDELDKERKIGANEVKIGELAVKLNSLEGLLKTVLAKSKV
jgi:hypothetical protein